MADILQGKTPSLSLMPPEIVTFLIATETGWSLEYINDLSERDFKVFSSLCLLNKKMNYIANQSKL